MSYHQKDETIETIYSRRIGSHNTLTPNATISISRDVMLQDSLLLGPSDEIYEGDPYRETRVDLCLDLPKGWTIALSAGMSWECWDAAGNRIELGVRKTDKYLRNWFRVGGCKWVVYVVTGLPSYLEHKTIKVQVAA